MRVEEENDTHTQKHQCKKCKTESVLDLSNKKQKEKKKNPL